jgi:hypothetical protein
MVKSECRKKVVLLLLWVRKKRERVDVGISATTVALKF